MTYRKKRSDVGISSAEKEPLETKSIEVQILRMELVLKPGSLRAFVDIEVRGILIRKLRIIQENGKEPWVSMPSERFQPPDGGPTQYTKLVKIKDKELMDQISEAVITAWRKRGMGKGEKSSPEDSGKKLK